MPETATQQHLTSAINLATSAHAKQTDRANQPYILHALRVMLKTKTLEQQIVAVLHDILEDTPNEPHHLHELGIPRQLVHSIIALTKVEGEEYSDYLGRVKADPIARVVKLADLEDNLNVLRLKTVRPKDAERLNKYVQAHAFLSAP